MKIRVPSKQTISEAKIVLSPEIVIPQSRHVCEFATFADYVSNQCSNEQQQWLWGDVVSSTPHYKISCSDLTITVSSNPTSQSLTSFERLDASIDHKYYGSHSNFYIHFQPKSQQLLKNEII